MNKSKSCLKRHFRFVASAVAAASMLMSNAFASYTATVNADLLNLRNAPEGDIIGHLYDGTTVSVLDTSNSEWYKISSNGKEGYVSSQYLTSPSQDADQSQDAGQSTEQTETPVVTSETETPDEQTDVSDSTSESETPAASVGRITCGTSVNLREETNTSSKILAEIVNGTIVVVNGKSDDWYEVSYNGKVGYVHPDYIKVSGGIVSAEEKERKAAAHAIKPAANSVSYGGSESKRDEVLAFAAKFLGTPYVYAGSTPNGFDCSGFVYYVFGNTVGSLPRVAQSQFDATTRIAQEDLLPGDLVFFGSSGYISHVGIYTGKNADGEDEFIHSPHTGDVVKYDTLTGSYGGRFQGGGRVIFD